MVRCYIAIGSNLKAPERQVRQAVSALDNLRASRLVAVSPWYGSTAVGPAGQPDYLNGVAALDTRMGALELLSALQAIEVAQGRVRAERWGARTLDLDLLLYGTEQIREADLMVPHPRMYERLFVLRPLLDLAPALTDDRGESLAATAAALDQGGVWLVGNLTSPTMEPRSASVPSHPSADSISGENL